MAKTVKTNYRKYQFKKYQRLAIDVDTHKRIVHHAKKKGMLIKDYVDSVVPKVK